MTVESPLMREGDFEEREPLLLCICGQLEKMIHGMKQKSVLIIGLGNREVTSDSLGPKMTDALFITRHFKQEFGNTFLEENQYGCVSAIAPELWHRRVLRQENYWRESCVKQNQIWLLLLMRWQPEVLVVFVRQFKLRIRE